MKTAAAPDADDELIADAMNKLDEPPPDALRPTQADSPLHGPAQMASSADLPWMPSPTLEALDKRRRPVPGTLCEGCPNAVWFTSPKEVKCYCRVMYITVWSNKEPNQITGCDGIWIGQDE